MIARQKVSIFLFDLFIRFFFQFLSVWGALSVYFPKARVLVEKFKIMSLYYRLLLHQMRNSLIILHLLTSVQNHK